MEQKSLMSSFENARILIVDDEEDTRDIFKRNLENKYDVDTAQSSDEALQMIRTNNYHIILTDLIMPGESGLELLNKIKTKWPQIAVMVISGKASIEMAVEAMKSGAYEFIEKPVEDLGLLEVKIQKILENQWQSNEIKRLRKKLSEGFDRAQIIGNSYEIQQLLQKVKKIAPLDSTVLITGETGVGKELFAETIYQNSKRKNQKFVTVNCGSLPETLLESMLFGHKKGAFTNAIKDKIGYFQEADGGTLLLDEITETSPAFHIKLLRTLEKGVIRKVGGERDIQVDVRIIAASNKNLEEEVKKGNLREDIYYRLNVISIHIPPLRERVQDIKLLANHFLRFYAKKYDKPDLKISEAAMSILLTRPWKGNVRELKNVIEHSAALASHDHIILEDLPSYLVKNKRERKYTRRYDNVEFPRAKKIFEEDYLDNLLLRSRGDVTKAAEISKIKRPNLYEKFKKYDIDPQDYRDRS